MAIKDFKEVVDRKGYKVDSEDRKIFEREIGKSYFGAGFSDMIEFILYDINDNKLPQGEDGKFVRYIHLNDSNIKDYFLISDNNFTKKLNGASEFIVDIEKLVKEAGYSNGIFKTQVTLLNRRVGSEKGEGDKLWIHEISPSRTEIRVLPLKNKKQPNFDLERRYNILTENKQFRDDTIYFAKQYIQNITTDKVLNAFSRIKGNQRDTQTYHALIQKEFKIESIEIFIQRVRTKFIESMDYFISGREWNINNINYGKPKNELDLVELTISNINQTFEQSLTSILQYYLPKRTIQEENELTPEQQVTFDEVKQILKSSVSDTLYTSTEPDKIDALVRGCTDPTALNYNPLAKENDGSCRYKIIDPPPIEIGGCKDSSALNYNPRATFDDGSCKYKDKVLKKTQTYYVWSTTASIKYKVDGVIKNLQGIEYDSFNITYDDNTIKWDGDVRLVPKIREPKPVMVSYQITNKSKTKIVKSGRPETYYFEGWRNASGNDTYSYEDSLTYDERIQFIGQALTFQYKDELGNLKTSSIIQPGGTTTICARLGSLVLPAGLTSTRLGDCGVEPPKVIRGCMDSSATNYNSRATEDDGSCKYVIPGCTDVNALNYNPSATQNDGSCQYPISTVTGCTDSTALNYNPNATEDDGSCRYPTKSVRGCTNPKALNYNPDATEDDGSCRYPAVVVRGCTDIRALNYNADATQDDGSCRYPQPPNSGGGGSGGGGGGGGRDIEFDSRGDDGINPFTNRGDYVNVRVPDRNEK